MGKSLYDRLREYGTSDVYPFHMPGHKRRMGGNGPAALERPYEIDLTEIGWNDNLHHAEGILKESMEMAANVYGADRSYYLVNGSTCGILSAVSAAARSGGRILMARNCHKSAYHGVILNHLRAEYVYPQNLWEFGVYGGLLADDIAKLVDNYPDICAILLTSPTYEGIVSDIGEISVICHRRGIPLIVDEAHGAHFTFGDNFPKSAVECGADLVIQSLHKTLPSLTQTAILHVQGDMIDREKLERYLKIYQTSSPSYVFLASMENCIRYMDGPGRSGMERFGERVRTLTGELEGLRTMKVLNDSVIGKNGVFDRDPSKIVITAPGAGLWLAKTLRERYHLELEMANADYVLAMTSLMDDEDGFARLKQALYEIDGERMKSPGARQTKNGGAAAGGEEIRGALLRGEENSGAENSEADTGLWTRIRAEVVMSMWEAVEAETELVDIDSEVAVGRIAADFVMVYPPGIPLLAPGERVTEEIRDILRRYLAMGFSLDGLKGDSGRMMAVVKG